MLSGIDEQCLLISVILLLRCGVSPFLLTFWEGRGRGEERRKEKNKRERSHRTNTKWSKWVGIHLRT